MFPTCTSADRNIVSSKRQNQNVAQNITSAQILPEKIEHMEHAHH